MEIQEKIHKLVDYNRENYMFNQEQNIERQYQEQDMRLKTFMMYREDMRDLVELTTGKMDSYILPILFELGLCFLMLVHGRLTKDGNRDVPTWLLWLYTVNLAEAFLYLFMAAWLAAHASICAHAHGVRLLTQFVRLPVPNQIQLDAARRYASEFEGGSDILRIPLVQQLAKRASSSKLSETRAPVAVADVSSDAAAESQQEASEEALIRMQQLNEIKSLLHIDYFRKLQPEWQAHDAYCRVCISLGTYTLVHAISYFLIGYFITMLDAVGAALCCAIMLSSLAWLLLKMDLLFRRSVFVFAAFLVMSGPILAVVSLTLLRLDAPQYIQDIHWYVVPIIYLMQVCIIVCIMFVAGAEHFSYFSKCWSCLTCNGGDDDDTRVALPLRFRTVLYLDVFGWLDQESEAREQQQQQVQPDTREQDTSGSSSSEVCIIPPRMKRELLSKCSANIARTDRELEAWESNQEIVKDTVCGVPGLRSSVEKLRANYDNIISILMSIRSDDRMPSLETFRDDLVSQQVWLNFNWSDRELYVNSETGEFNTNYTQLPRNSIISDIDSLQSCLERLEEHANTLKHSVPERRVPEAVTASVSPPQGIRRSSTSNLATPKYPHRQLGSSRASESSRPSGSGASPPRSNAPTRSLAFDQLAGPAQETRFGGREALDLQGGSHSAFDHDRTFYYRDDHRRETNVPAGQIPWTAFKRSSLLLIFVWLIGVAVYCIEPWILNDFNDYDDPLAREKITQHDASMLEGAQIAFHTSRLPGRPLAFSAVGLSCDSAMSDRLLIADDYGAFTVWLPSEGASMEPSVATMNSDVKNCLDALPAFRDAGLVGISMECRFGGHCDSLLLGMGGMQLVRCPLAPNERNNKIPTVVNLPRATGNRAWTSIVSSKSGRIGRTYWWGLARDKSRPQRLRVRQDNARAFAMPSDSIRWQSDTIRTNRSSMRGGMVAELARPTFGQHLHSPDGIILYSLAESEGIIQAWSIDGKDSSNQPTPSYLGLWLLPEGLRWNAMCSAGKHLYIVGMRQGDPSSEIWRFDLPFQVASLSEAQKAIVS